MNTIEQLPATDPDLDAIIDSLMTGKPIPDAVRERMRQEGETVREQLRQTIGPTNMAADLLRESRDE